MKNNIDHAINRTIGIAGLGLWFIASLLIFLQLIAIPKEMAIGFPPELQCEVYALARRGRGCAELGSIASNPILFALALTVSSLCAWLFGRHALVDISPPSVFALQVGLVVCLAASVRFTYFFQGRVTFEHMEASTIITGCALICMASSGWYLVRIRRKNG